MDFLKSPTYNRTYITLELFSYLYLYTQCRHSRTLVAAASEKGKNFKLCPWDQKTVTKEQLVNEYSDVFSGL